MIDQVMKLTGKVIGFNYSYNLKVKAKLAKMQFVLRQDATDTFFLEVLHEGQTITPSSHY